MSPAK